MIDGVWYWAALFTSVIAFWSLPRGVRFGFLGAASWAFLLWYESTLPSGGRSVIGLTVWVLAFYFLAPRAVRPGPWSKRITPLLILGIIGYLAYFKYVPPLVSGLAGESDALRIVIPLGISYFSFKLVHYAVEVGRGNVPGNEFGQFLAYMFLFPIFTAGPIERFDHFLKNHDERWSSQTAAEGMTRIMHGLVKKFFIADIVLTPYLGTLQSADLVLERMPELPTYKVWAFCFLKYMIAYMDFSAYSDIAIGSARLFGIRIMENFNWPLFAPNIGDFWKRWHMTLAGWCQSYVFMPTLGLTRKPYLAVYATFIVMGLWHEGKVNWIFWGLFHGTGVAVYLTWARYKRKRKWTHLDRWPWRVIGIGMTVVFVTISFAFTTTTFLPGAMPALRIFAKLFFIDL